MGLLSDATRGLAARGQSAYFEMRVSVINDPDPDQPLGFGGRVRVELLGKEDFAGKSAVLWHGSCSRSRLIRELPDLLGAIAHIASASAQHPVPDAQMALPGL